MIHDQYDDLLRLPWERGGRFARGTADCLGVTLEMARRRGVGLIDPWDRVAELHILGRSVDHLFPPGWALVDGPAQDDDIALFSSAGELGAGYVLDSLIYSATARHGVFRAPLARFRVDQIWRGR